MMYRKANAIYRIIQIPFSENSYFYGHIFMCNRTKLQMAGKVTRLYLLDLFIQFFVTPHSISNGKYPLKQTAQKVISTTVIKVKMSLNLYLNMRKKLIIICIFSKPYKIDLSKRYKKFKTNKIKNSFWTCWMQSIGKFIYAKMVRSHREICVKY